MTPGHSPAGSVAALVGRERERAELAAVIEGAAAGRGGTILVVGEAGIGKTRLVSTVLETHGDPALTGWGVSPEDETAPPLWPWRAALGRLGVDMPAAPAGRFELALGLVAELRKRPGAVVVLDDAHWADPASVRLLEVLAPMLHTEPAALVVTFRPDDLAGSELERVLPALEHGPGVRAINLGGLDEVATTELLTATASATPSAELVALVHARTGGNPFFVIQVGRLLTSPESLAVPVAVRDAVRRRLNRLTPACNELLRAAAVIGEHVDVWQLAELVDMPLAELAALLEEAAAAQIMSDLDGDAVRFRHALVRETLLTELPARTRATLHLALAQLLERSRPEAVEALAFHFGEATLVGGAGRALRYYRASADATRTAHEHAAEARALGHAVALVERDPSLGDAAALMLDRARALYRSGDLRGAWRAAVAVASRARATQRVDLLAGAAITVRGVSDPDLNGELLALCEECLRAPAVMELSRDLRVAVEAQAMMARIHLRAPVSSERAAALLAEAELSGDRDARALTLQLRHMTLDHPLQVEERLALARRASGLATQSGDGNLEAWASGWAVDAYYQLAQRPELDRAIERLTSLAAETGELLVRWHALIARASLAMLEGRFAEARATAHEAAEIAAAGGHGGGRFVDQVFRSQIAILTGDTDDVPVLPPNPGDADRPEVRGYLAMIHAALGRRDEARTDLRVALSSLDTVAEDALYQQWLCVVVFAAWMLRAPDGAGRLRSRLEPFSGQVATVTRGQGGTIGLVDEFLAMAARLAGDEVAAVEFLEHAIATADRISARPAAARSRYELASLLAETQGAASRRARAMLRTAIEGGRELGMQPLVREAEALEARWKSAEPALSRRERQVAEHVARGHTNKQIAGELFLSERTVENHVRAILDKLGFSSRSQIAAWIAAADGAGDF